MEDDTKKNLVFYTDNRLPCPQRVLLTAAELGIELTTMPIDILKNGHKTPAYAKLTNNFTAVPFLTSTAMTFTLRESRAISRYLCHLHTSSLMPKVSDLLATAKFEEAASMELTCFDPVANRLVFEAHFKPIFGGQADEGLVQELRGRLEGVLDGMERALGEGRGGEERGREGGGRKYMAGEEFSLVDVFYVPYMLHLSSLYGEEIFEGRQRLGVWWKMVRERPSVGLIRSYRLERS